LIVVCVKAKTILPLNSRNYIEPRYLIINLWLHGYRHSLGPDNMRTQSTYRLFVSPLPCRLVLCACTQYFTTYFSFIHITHLISRHI
jgi:hypothetical protein